MRHVEKHSRSFTHLLETPWEAHCAQGRLHCRHGNRQTCLQGLDGKQRRCRIAQLRITDQRRSRQIVQDAKAAAQGPARLRRRQGVIAPDKVQVSGNVRGMRQQALWCIAIRADRRFASAIDPGLLEADGLPRRPQPGGMVERNAGDDGAIGRIGIHGIEPPAQPHFKNRHLDPSCGKGLPRRQGAELEIGERHRPRYLPRRLDPGEGRAQGFIVNRHTVDAHPFVVIEKVRRGVTANAITCRTVKGFQKGTGRPLAIGAADDDHRTMLHLSECRLDANHALQPKLDAALPFGMQAFEMGQPVRKGQKHCRC